jgi:23S rRNA (cytidine1920-2'-O)/16S rRNA (cytidine1409-2'-O)-methyltransferase
MVKEVARLDKWLVDTGLVESRERAKALILLGKVEVDGRPADKPGIRVQNGQSISLRHPDHPYVSRGGLKLEKALDHFGIDPAGRVILDVGASTGGFTHCLLMRGARKGYAVDVGYGQFAWSLRQDPRVVVLERTNIRYLKPERIMDPVTLAVIDISFISLKKVIPKVFSLVEQGAELLALIKPQFEVGKGKVGKGGIVRSEDLHNRVLEDIKDFSRKEGWEMGGIVESSLKGTKGNKEFFIWLRKPR